MYTQNKTEAHDLRQREKKPLSGCGRPASEQVNNEQYYREPKKNVEGPGSNVKGQKTEQPQDE